MHPFATGFNTHLHALLATAERRLTALELEKKLASTLKMTRKQTRSNIRQLIAAGELTYTNEDGHTFVVPSYRRPVRVSERIWLSPPDCRVDPGIKEVVVHLQAGIAFGGGSHASTRLALKAIDRIVSLKRSGHLSSPGTMLDVGTGTGVLMIAALLLGLKAGLGIDLDACARAEARENARLNDLERRICITSETVRQIKGSFNLVTANLRLPSLLRYCQILQNLTAPGGWIILSGIKTEELFDILESYGRLSLEPAGRWQEAGWVCQVFKK
jgi:ribosomal protein L11 methyltransferase